MLVYNKLKIAILAILSSSSTFALTLEPIQVQSHAGSLLYAEIKFKNANPNAHIEAGLADTQDLITLGMAQQAPGNLNFYTRKSADGTGVIVITSTRPVIETDLNLLLKIKEGDATHIQHIKTGLNAPNHADQAPMAAHEQALKPQVIVSEKDIALNLPTSSQYSTPATPTTAASHREVSSDMPLAINVAALPTISVATQTGSANDTHAVATPTTQTSAQSTPSITQVQTQPTQAVLSIAQPIQASAPIARSNTTPSVATPEPSKADAQAKVSSEHKKSTRTAEAKKTQTSQKKPLKHATANTQAAQKHVVKANESLWKIAAAIAAQTHQSIPAVMKKIQQDNQHAFIAGDINRMRRGAALNLAVAVNPAIHAAQRPTTAKPTTARPRPTQSAKEKYRLHHAEMTLVAENNVTPNPSNAKQPTSTAANRAELSAKVMTAREKTVKLQKSVSTLGVSLNQKDQRIQVLNARLAELQQQLKQQNRASKQAH